MKISRFIMAALTLHFVISVCPVDALAQSAINVAVVQLQTADVGNFNKMRSLAKQAKALGAELVIYPEGSVFGWLNPEVFTKAAPIPGTYSDQFAAIAAGESIWVAAGLAEQGPKAGPGSMVGAHQAYDSGILINPQGQLVLHHRKFNVLKNAFDPAACKKILNQDECSYIPGSLSDITTIQTPFGKTSLLVCADAFTYAPAKALHTLKGLQPDFVIVPWGITATEQSQCGGQDYNATVSTAEAAEFLETAFVVGANAVGNREYGRYLPSVYCGTSGYATPTGESKEAQPPSVELALFAIGKSFDAKAGPIWNNPDAQTKCPKVCTQYTAQWNGQWTTTIPGLMSVCGCVPHGME